MESTFIGFVLVIVAAFAWAVGNVIAKHAAGAHEPDMFALIVWSSLIPPLPLALLSYAFEGGPAVWHAVASAGALTWGCVFVLAWGATLFGFASWAALLHRYPTGLIAPFALLIPVSGLASGAILLGESLAPLQALGALLVFAGLAENVFGAELRTWLARSSVVRPRKRCAPAPTVGRTRAITMTARPARRSRAAACPVTTQEYLQVRMRDDHRRGIGQRVRLHGLGLPERRGR